VAAGHKVKWSLEGDEGVRNAEGVSLLIGDRVWGASPVFRLFLARSEWFINKTTCFVHDSRLEPPLLTVSMPTSLIINF